MEGLQRLKNNNYVLTKSKVCDEALKNYKIVHNPMPVFLETFVEPTKDMRTLRSDFRPIFEKWLAGNDRENRISKREFWNVFNAELKRQGKPVVDSREINGKEYIVNYKLKNVNKGLN